MENYNPLLAGNQSPAKFITIGEVMLRLTPPNYEKIRMATSFEASYGGSEANIALSLANLGIDSTFFSVVPNNSLGKSAVRWLRSNDVHCTPMILSTPDETPTHRLGTYYLETGYGIRPSKVTYDRKHSAFTEYDLNKVDLDALLEGFDWLHLSGITPALGPGCAYFVLRCLETAKKKGLTVSFDGNFRSALWTWEEARDFCTKCLPYVDVLFGIEPYHLWKDEEDRKVTGRTAYPCSRVMKNRTRFSNTLSNGTPTSNVWPAMCGMPIPVLKTVSKPLCGTKDIPLRASSSPSIFSTVSAVAMLLPAA